MLNRKKTNCEEAKKIPLGDFLAHFGYFPIETKQNDSYYLSPLREEKKPSFRINHRLNIWYDYGISKGGTIIDLGILLLNCSIEELLQTLTDINFSSDQPIDKKYISSTIKIIETKQLTSQELFAYIRSREVKKEIAVKYCKEANFSVNEKFYFAIAFQNNSGGFELRNKYFKGSSSPKDITLISNKSDSICVFEGFFDFLSYFDSKIEMPGSFDFLILNSIAFLNKSFEIISKYKFAYIFLDNDNAGTNGVLKLQALGMSMCIDMSNEYKGYKDLNAYKIVETQKQINEEIQLTNRSKGLSM